MTRFCDRHMLRYAPLSEVSCRIALIADLIHLPLGTPVALAHYR